MKEKFENGITLIVLIITIIIILIISSVLLYAYKSENGVIEKIRKIGKKTEEDLTNAQYRIDELKGNADDGGIGIKMPEDEILLVFSNIKSSSFKVNLDIKSKEGEITYVKYGIKEKDEDEEYEYFDSTNTEYNFFDLLDGTYYDVKCLIYDVNNKVTETEEYEIKTEYNLGKRVTNYKTASEQLDTLLSNNKGYYIRSGEADDYAKPDWRFLYDDEYHYFLISARYVPNSFPLYKGDIVVFDEQGSAATASGAYYKIAGLVDTINYSDFSGYSEEEKREIFDKEKLEQKHLEKYFADYTDENASITDSVAAFCDPEIWNIFKGSLADFAMQGPTVEMIRKAFKRILTYDEYGSINFIGSYGEKREYYPGRTALGGIRYENFSTGGVFYLWSKDQGMTCVYQYLLGGYYLNTDGGNRNRNCWEITDSQPTSSQLGSYRNWQSRMRPVVSIPKDRFVLQEQPDGTLIIDNR